MRRLSDRTRAQIVATLAALQTGIEPATLTLLVANHAVDPADFGWVVSAGQIGMASGAVLGWRRSGADQALLGGAAVIGVAASLAMMMAHDLVAVLALRLVFGGVMGLLLTRATAVAARQRPHNAVGVIVLAQQLLSTAMLAGLPIAAAAWGPATALGTVTIAPLIIALLILVPADEAIAVLPAAPALREAAAQHVPIRALVPMAIIVAVTMMVWSYVATIGSALKLGEADVGLAIALGSLASAPAAVLAAFASPRLTPWLTAMMCGAAMLSPLFVPLQTGLAGYLTTMILFNAGTTFATIRFTAWAMRAGQSQRHFAAMVQCVAMSIGPAVGAVAMRAGGVPALAALATAGTMIAIIVPAVGQIHRGRQGALDDALVA